MGAQCGGRSNDNYYPNVEWTAMDARGRLAEYLAYFLPTATFLVITPDISTLGIS
jgi:hypothetical protein